MTEEEWWEADAERLNEMAETARNMRVVVKVGKKDLESKSLPKVFKKLRKKKNGSK